MNKKQLVVVWLMTLSVCLTFILTPKRYIFKGEGGGRISISIAIAGLSVAALLLKVPPTLVLLAAGIIGVIFFR